MSDAIGPTGIYTCLVPNTSGGTALPYYVGVYGSPDEASLSTDELTFDPSSHTVSYVSSGGPVDTVTWSRNGDPITSSTSPYQLSQSLTSGVTSTFLHTLLTITGGDAEDYNGTFSCAVSNSRGPAPVQSLDIHINITCSSDLAVQTIRWLDGEGQELANNVGQQKLVLTIEEVREELNNTMYRCEVTVSLASGQNVLVDDIIFIVSDGLAPRHPVFLMSNSITTSSVDIQWTVMGTFIPELPEQFVLLYGLSPQDLSQRSPVVTATSSSQIYSIQLNSLATGTEYHYRVSSTNEFTTVLSDIRFFTTDDSQSGPVYALELNSTSDTTLLISWGEPVSPNGNILSYSITITDLRDDSTVRTENSGVEEMTSFMETDLEPGVPYSVSITAVNRAGTGERSMAIIFTRELTPSVAPRNVRISRPSATVIEVSWRPLTLTEARGFVSHYTVTYSPQIISGRRKRQAAMTEVVPRMNANMTSIDGLDPDTVYNVQVSATTGGGGGVNSAVISVEVPQEPLSAAVVGGAVGGVLVAVLLLIAVSILVAALLIWTRKQKQQKNDVASKNTADESPAEYDEVRDFRSTSGNNPLPAKNEQISLEQCPAYGTAKRDIAFQSATALYEVVSPK